MQTVPNQRDRQMGDVDADPLSFKPLGDGDSCPAATERVEDNITLIAAGGDDPFEESFWFLRGVAEPLLRL